MNTNDWIGLDNTGIVSDYGKEDQLKPHSQIGLEGVGKMFDHKKRTPRLIINALTDPKV